jgi:hypothetical protein
MPRQTHISRLNKTKYYTVKGYYGKEYGWEVVYQSQDKQDALDRLKEYNDNEKQYPHRLGVVYE